MLQEREVHKVVCLLRGRVEASLFAHIPVYISTPADVASFAQNMGDVIKLTLRKMLAGFSR